MFPLRQVGIHEVILSMYKMRLCEKTSTGSQEEKYTIRTVEGMHGILTRKEIGELILNHTLDQTSVLNQLLPERTVANTFGIDTVHIYEDLDACLKSFCNVHPVAEYKGVGILVPKYTRLKNFLISTNMEVFLLDDAGAVDFLLDAGCISDIAVTYVGKTDAGIEFHHTYRRVSLGRPILVNYAIVLNEATEYFEGVVENIAGASERQILDIVRDKQGHIQKVLLRTSPRNVVERYVEHRNTFPEYYPSFIDLICKKYNAS